MARIQRLVLWSRVAGPAWPQPAVQPCHAHKWGPAAWIAIRHEAPWMTVSDRHRNYGARDRTTMPLKCRHHLDKPVCHGTVNIGTVPAAVMTDSENESRAHGTVLLECATAMTSRDIWKGAWHTVLRDLLGARPRVLQIITKQTVTVWGRPNQVPIYNYLWKLWSWTSQG